MAALFGYMLAIVITLGGYLAGLHWLINPPDPWLPNPKLVQSGVQQFAKKRVPIVKPAEANPIALTVSADTGAKPANIKIPTLVSASETEGSQSTDTVIVQASHRQLNRRGSNGPKHPAHKAQILHSQAGSKQHQPRIGNHGSANLRTF
jgi:hypothetical protein